MDMNNQLDQEAQIDAWLSQRIYARTRMISIISGRPRRDVIKDIIAGKNLEDLFPHEEVQQELERILPLLPDPRVMDPLKVIPSCKV